MTMAAATRNSSPKQRASRSIAAPDNLRLDTLRHHRPERDVGLRADHEWMRFSRFPVLQPGQPVGRGVEDRVVLKLDIDLHPQSISRRHHVVETNVHYPTDHTLLRDGVRVLTTPNRRHRCRWC